MSKSVEFDRSKFDAALQRFRAFNRKAVGAVLKEQARLALRNIINFTAPGSKSSTGTEAKQRGEAKVAADILKVLTKGKGKDVASESAADIHKRHRDRRGRVRRELDPKIKVRAGDLAKLLRDKKRMVGFLASGWKAAAEKLGAKVPNWVARHSGQGSSKIRNDAAMVEVSATNSVDYADRLNLNRIVQQAVNAQARSMVRQVEAQAAKEAARRAGFR